jgi:hypothetical protein
MGLRRLGKTVQTSRGVEDRGCTAASRRGPNAGSVGQRGATRGVTVVLTLVLLLSACSSGRSVAAFCGELDRGMRDLNASAQANMETDDILVGLMGIAGSLGEYQRLLERLADVAPKEIQQDMEVVRDTVAGQLDVGAAASDPFGAMIASFGQAMMNQGSFERVDHYARTHCGQGAF